MKTNVGTLDRVFRILAAVAILVLYYANLISGTLAIVLMIIATAFIVTSFIGVCPLYSIFRISTARRTSKPS